MDNKVFIPANGLNIEYLAKRGVIFHKTESKDYVFAELPSGWHHHMDGSYWSHITDDAEITVISSYDRISTNSTGCYSIMGSKTPEPWWKFW